MTTILTANRYLSFEMWIQSKGSCVRTRASQLERRDEATPAQ